MKNLSQKEPLSKRLFDLLVSAMAILLLLPLMLLVIILVYLDLGRPVFYRQPRVGKGERLFVIYKFRTMKNGTGRSKPEYNWDNGVPADFVFKTPGLEQGRITKIGRFLRKSSLDELPQFYHVFLGQMSIVGPRPEIPEIVERYNSMQRRRLAVKPGITGLAQIRGRAAMTYGDKFRYDLEYLDNWSFWLDIKIVTVTCYQALFGKGAY